MYSHMCMYISLICVFVIAVFTTYWFGGMGFQVSIKLRLAFESLTAVSFKANITLYFQVDSTMRVVLTLKCKTTSTSFAFIHDFIMTILVFCHCTRRTKESGAISTWCRRMEMTETFPRKSFVGYKKSCHICFAGTFKNHAWTLPVKTFVLTTQIVDIFEVSWPRSVLVFLSFQCVFMTPIPTFVLNLLLTMRPFPRKEIVFGF